MQPFTRPLIDATTLRSHSRLVFRNRDVGLGFVRDLPRTLPAVNSWVALLSPRILLEEIATLADPTGRGEVVAFFLTFFAFSLAVDFFVEAASRLHRPAEET